MTEDIASVTVTVEDDKVGEEVQIIALICMPPTRGNELEDVNGVVAGNGAMIKMRIVLRRTGTNATYKMTLHMDVETTGIDGGHLDTKMTTIALLPLLLRLHRDRRPHRLGEITVVDVDPLAIVVALVIIAMDVRTRVLLAMMMSLVTVGRLTMRAEIEVLEPNMTNSIITIYLIPTTTIGTIIHTTKNRTETTINSWNVTVQQKGISKEEKGPSSEISVSFEKLGKEHLDGSSSV